MNDPVKVNEKEWTGFSFGTALLFLEKGYKLARKGWNGKNQWVTYTSGKVLDLKVNDIWTQNVKDAALENDGKIEILPYLSLKTAQNKLQIGWIASQSDMLAEDWFVVGTKGLDGTEGVPGP